MKLLEVGHCHRNKFSIVKVTERWSIAFAGLSEFCDSSQIQWLVFRWQKICKTGNYRSVDSHARRLTFDLSGRCRRMFCSPWELPSMALICLLIRIIANKLFCRWLLVKTQFLARSYKALFDWWILIFLTQTKNLFWVFPGGCAAIHSKSLALSTNVEGSKVSRVRTHSVRMRRLRDNRETVNEVIMLD